MRGTSVSRLVKDEIRALWRTRSYDTMQLADHFDLPEEVIYRVLSCRVAIDPPQTLKAARAARLRHERRLSAKAKAGRQYRLVEGGYYLHESRRNKTADASDAWKGDAEQAVAVCAKYKIAKNMMMELVS